MGKAFQKTIASVTENLDQFRGVMTLAKVKNRAGVVPLEWLGLT